jgi:tartrate dehydrogenase/decarboxylase/D-malate dehydrogenase
MKTYKIACIPGDGIGKEVIPAGELVLQALANKSKSFQLHLAISDGVVTGTANMAK